MTKKLTPIIAILAITGLIAYAMHLKVDGVVLAAGIAIIAGLGGFVAPHRKPPDKR